MKRFLLVVAIGAGVALGGCGDDEAPTATGTTTRPAGASATRSVPAATAVAPKLGNPLSVAEWSGPLEVTVHSYRQPLPTPAPTPKSAGHQYAAIDVQVCNRTESLVQMVGPKPFALTFASRAPLAPYNFATGDFPSPAFPKEHSLAGGACVRGWIPFDVPDGRPTGIRYSESSQAPGGGKAYTWPVG
ncbi:hypothetical protein Val02_49010 [Virgisporangium aliadipatigenens]|uniref:DUF4352 domain-containing protein n=1 Tax=Virgisporangium aliadipatigenens TaxID=741659 RepID=A0A8J3YQ87_9ACTN|nr:hypothetical protein [Virgisporangium aliadipatigenens]GIJ48015.1 hypothetical protein Val02_49010 [Virgisporangium aliadipatigenens]